ncbi:MAG: protein kinase [Polyangiales bacterium]
MSCPDELTLWALVQGTVDAESMSTLDAHLDGCAECREVVGAVASGVRSQSSRTQNDSAPATLGRFEVGDPLGEGAMGVVYAGMDPELERPVALKVLHAAADSAKGRARLVREAQAMARLAHAHVLTVYEVGTDGDTVFIAMERGDRNLRTAMKQGETQETLVAAMKEAGHGLAAAHRAEILHRDFKPENVMLMSDGGAKVADFGLAGAIAGSGSEGPIDLTRTGALLGTPVYMAPERLRGEVGDARSDQFSFCVAMWEVVCGERPFGGSSVEDLLRAIASGAPTAGVPDSLARVLRRGLQANSEARFDSMDALLEALPPGLATGASPRSLVPFGAALVAAAALLVGVGYAAYPAENVPTVPLMEVGACDELTLPAQALLEGWPAARVEMWRARWEESRAALCAQTPPARAAECLAEQAAEVARFAVPDASGEAFIQMPSPEACAAGAVPMQPELSEVRALLRSGDAERARSALAELGSETTEAALLAARAERMLAHFELAEGLARDALFRAQEEEDPWNAAEAWLELVAVAGAAGEYEQAARDLAHAEQAVLAVGTGSLREQLLHRQGLVRTQMGDFAGARSALDAALELRTQRLGAETVELAAFHTSLGHLARLEERLDDAFEHHSIARGLNATLDPEHAWVARDLHNLGGILRRQHRWDDALDYYRQSIAIRRERLGQTHPEVALGLNSVGLVLFETDDFEGARTTWLEARAIFMDNDHADSAMTEHNLALANLALNEPEQALSHALVALRRDEARLGPDAKRVGAELVTVAKALVRLRRFDEAQTRVTRAKEIAVLLGDDALAEEAEAVMAQRRRSDAAARRRRAASAETSSMIAPVDQDDPPVAEPETMAPQMATQMAPTSFRAAGSATYGGGQAWD